MPRAITTHAINPCNQALKVVALDGPGAGGASHAYDVMLEQRTQLGTSEATSYRTLAALRFQNGPVKETGEGANGITHEALLAVLVDRLESFQRGPYACEENAAALHGLRSALRWLNIRTQRREAAGVEGTMQPDPAERRERAAAAAEQLADAGEACATCSGFGLLVITADGIGCPGCGKVAGQAVEHEPKPKQPRFYLLSLKHTRPSENMLTWWGPNSRGYTWDLNRAGEYSEQEANEICDPRDGDTIAIPVEKARAVAWSTIEHCRGSLDKLGALDAWTAHRARGA